MFLKENKFYEKEYLEKNNQYIASLIKYVDTLFKYELKASVPNTNYKYNYKIVAETNVINQANRSPIYSFKEELVPLKTQQFNSSSKMVIYEPIQIDYNKYNNIIKQFIKEYDLEDINSTLTIRMYVNVEGVSKSSAPVSSLVIPLTTKTVAIDLEANSVNATDLNVYKEIANKDKLYIAILTFILTIMVIIELFIFMNNSKDETSRYEAKIKKILLNYDSYIQKVNNDVDFEDYQKLELKSFEDLLQIRDTISQPIIMLENKTKKETDFLIQSRGNVLYTYKISIKEFKETNVKQKTTIKEKNKNIKKEEK